MNKLNTTYYTNTKEINIEIKDQEMYISVEGSFCSHLQHFHFTKEQTQDLLLKLLKIINNNEE